MRKKMSLHLTHCCLFYCHSLARLVPPTIRQGKCPPPLSICHLLHKNFYGNIAEIKFKDKTKIHYIDQLKS